MPLDLSTNSAIPVNLRTEATRLARRLGLPLADLEDALQDEARCRAFLLAHQRREERAPLLLRLHVAAPSARA